MPSIIKQIATFLPGPVNVSRHIEKSGLDVFFPFYHAISDRQLPHMKHLYKLRNIVQFEEDIDFLLQHFEPVKMSEYLSGNFSKNKQKPPMVLSFDDGLLQCYEEIMPILLKKELPAVFFLNNAFIDNKSMFFRFKASLLIEAMETVTDKQKAGAAELVHCHVSELKKRLLAVSYVEREITDQIAHVFEYSFDDYLRTNPIYLSSMHVREMMDKGFEFGSHGIDHPLFSLLTSEKALSHIGESMEDIHQRYGLNYKYFAFPFTDYGVQDNTIEDLFKKNIIDAGFGTAGLKDDKWPDYYQRVPMEQLGVDAKKTLRSELNMRRIRIMTSRNKVSRGKPKVNIE